MLKLILILSETVYLLASTKNSSPILIPKTALPSLYQKKLPRPHTILLKLNHSIDITTTLANRAQADQTKEERQRESFLLSERWKLMQPGTDRREIKI